MAKRYHVAEAPASRAWDLLTDADGYGEWNPSVVSLAGPITEGGTISLVSKVNPETHVPCHGDRDDRSDQDGVVRCHAVLSIQGCRTYQLIEQDGATEFSMTEVFSGPLSGLITKAIPDMTDSFNQFADGLKAAAEAPSG